MSLKTETSASPSGPSGTGAEIVVEATAALGEGAVAATEDYR